MDVIYSLQPLLRSIFLAGPTPRSADVPSWRPQALEMLEKFGFAGTVLVPETEGWQPHDHYDDQIHWEWEAINLATVVVFWVPREMETMPAFTTNVEFGMLVSSGKVILGAPSDAPKMKYLKALAERHAVPVYDTLEDTLRAALDRANGVFGAPIHLHPFL